MIAIEVSSAAGRPPHGGIGGAIRKTVNALLCLDSETRYDLCYRFSRWRRGDLFRPKAPNVRVRVLQDPWNALLIPGARLFHSMGIHMPRTPRVTKLLTVHDLNAVRNLDWVRPEWHEKRSRRIGECIARSDHVVTYSEFIAGEIRDEYGLPKEQTHAVPLGVDSEVFRPPHPEAALHTREDYGDFVLAIGLTTPRKNFERLVDAIAPLSDVRLVIVGRRADGEARLIEAIERAKLGDRVSRLPSVREDELIALLGAARVCAVPSLYEGFGLTPLEAMACGTPVLCSRAASLPEVVGDAALMVDARDVEAMSDGLRRLLEDSELAEEHRQRGFKRAREMSWHATAARMRTLYRKLGGV